MRITLLLILLFTCTVLRAQTSTILLPKNQVQAIFTPAVKQQFEINYPIERVYNYTDKSGTYYCALTENVDSVSKTNDTLNHEIKAFMFKVSGDSLKKVWDIYDYTAKSDANESRIWFWTHYIDFTDYDGDGIIDPIIVYGTQGDNGYDDGRIKFIVYYHGKKYVLRHQNGVLDGQRQTQPGEGFNTLPSTIKKAIQTKMNEMTKKGQAIFAINF